MNCLKYKMLNLNLKQTFSSFRLFECIKIWITFDVSFGPHTRPDAISTPRVRHFFRNAHLDICYVFQKRPGNKVTNKVLFSFERPMGDMNCPYGKR